jgi:superfamily I DNA/RNA helicase/mRNA-degrading endonuclease RelE of RelBE toxin-antitoxin system
MSVRVSLYRKAEEELYKLDGMVKARFYDFCHTFRGNPDQPGLDLKKLKGDSRIYRAKVNQSYRALMVPVGVDSDGTQHWLVIAVRHRKDVYDELQVAVNRVTGEIEFVDLAVVGESALRRAGITLTPAEPEADQRWPEQQPTRPADKASLGEEIPDEASPDEGEPAAALLGAHDAQQLRDLGVADQLIDLALAVTSDAELDDVLRGAPLLSKDVLYGLAAGMSVEEVRREITGPVQLERQPNLDDIAAALTRTKVTTVDDALRQAVEEGDFRAWKVFLHPTQERVAHQNYRGSARVTGGPGTGKTIVALHRVKHLAERLTADGAPAVGVRPILLTTFTANLAADLRARLASLVGPELLQLVDVMHIDQLAARVLGENTSARHRKKRVNDQAALAEMRQLLAELDERRWDPEFLFEEWDQVVLGHSVTTRMEYFHVRRAGRGRGLTRPERSEVWKLVEQFTARLDKLGVETWGQAAERAARYEITRAAQIEGRRSDDSSAVQVSAVDESSGRRYRDYRYRHVVVDEAQDLRAAHWKLLRAMVDPGTPNDLFIAGDTHQRIYDHHVTLGALGINIRGGRSQRLTLSYRTTREILAWALAISNDVEIDYDDLDDGTDTLAGFRSVLHGPRPTFVQYATWEEELAGLAQTLTAWRAELSKAADGTPLDPTGRVAVCVADRDRVTETLNYLTTRAGLSCAELTRDGSDGRGEIHIGTMHRFKGLEYERLAVIGVSDNVIPRPAVHRYRTQDPVRYERELRKARALLFVAVTRARDTLTITWHGQRSALLPAEVVS